jgi:predicted RNA methylase
MPFVIQARNFAALNHINAKISKTVVFKDIDFHKVINTKVNINVIIEAKQNGLVNAIVLKSKTFLSKNQAIWGTTDLNMPVIIPVKEKRVIAGDKINIKIRYIMGEGFEKFHVDIV